MHETYEVLIAGRALPGRQGDYNEFDTTGACTQVNLRLVGGIRLCAGLPRSLLTTVARTGIAKRDHDHDLEIFDA